MRQEWTTSEQQLLACMAKTHTVKELCGKLERSKHSVINQLNRMGIAASPDYKSWTSREVKIIEGMLKDFSYEEIARELGRSSASVRGFIRRTMNPGVRRRVWKPTRQQVDRIAALRKERKSIPQISRIMRCTVTNVRSVVKNENIKRGIGYA